MQTHMLYNPSDMPGQEESLLLMVTWLMAAVAALLIAT